MTTQLSYVNASFEVPMPDVFLFQRNRLSKRAPLVWKLIRRCSYGWRHEVPWSEELTLALCYGDGNWAPARVAKPGTSYLVWAKPGGGVEVRELPRQSVESITVLNSGHRGRLEAFLCRGGRPLAWEPLAPGQSAAFAFDPVLVFGTGLGIEEGRTVRQTPSDVFGSINLQGVAQADVLVTGGGFGPDAGPLTFRLNHVKTRVPAQTGAFG